VTISKPFYMGVYPVTIEEWVAVMGMDSGVSRAVLYNAKSPKWGLGWDEAVDFCKTLSKKTGRRFHLPTEAQREYACRAGTRTAYSFGDDTNVLGDYACLAGRYSSTLVDNVGQTKPNDWGLYDMLANTVEWCSDYYGRYDAGDVTDPTGPADGQKRVVRGSFRAGFGCRCALRQGMNPDKDRYGPGLRVVMDADDAAQSVPASGPAATKSADK